MDKKAPKNQRVSKDFENESAKQILFGFYLAYSSIKRTVWTGFVMILLNVLYDLILICKQLNVQVSIKRTGFA